MALSRNKPIVCPVLIGRAADLTALHVLIDQAKQGEGQVALISGGQGLANRGWSPRQKRMPLHRASDFFRETASREIFPAPTLLSSTCYDLILVVRNAPTGRIKEQPAMPTVDIPRHANHPAMPPVRLPSIDALSDPDALAEPALTGVWEVLGRPYRAFPRIPPDASAFEPALGAYGVYRRDVGRADAAVGKGAQPGGVRIAARCRGVELVGHPAQAPRAIIRNASPRTGATAR